MDFHLKQPVEKQHRQKEESDEEQQQQQQEPFPAKFPRLHLQLQSHPQQQSSSTLNCFLPYPSDSKPPLPPRSPCRIGGFFSTDQWQELELQALIFRHMVAGAAVPIELLQLVKKSLLNSSFNLNNSFSYYHSPLLQGAGCWAKGALDPEPGRCRRTDGKKWRCSREVVVGHKYCERHVHRGRNRSRKPVESAATTASAPRGTPFGRGGGGGAVSGSDSFGVGTPKSSVFATSKQYAGLVGDGAHFSLSGPTPSLDIFQLNQGGSVSDGKFLFKAQNDTSGDTESKLRPFFDDWPKPNSTSIGGASYTNSATCLSISTPGVTSSVDFLKLSTGNGGDQLSRKIDGEWSGGNQVAAAGGPLAEALPRSASGSSCVAA